MKIGDLEIDATNNPAVLETATWDRSAAWQSVQRAGAELDEALNQSRRGSELPAVGSLALYGDSCVRPDGGLIALCRLPDAQQVFVELGGAGASAVLGEPVGQFTLPSGKPAAAFPTDASVVDKFCGSLRPDKGPRALRDTPRLGIGCRMTTTVWPAMFSAMQGRGFAANTIQNSVRELNFLDDILACRPAPTNYACGFGTIETGYTGSTFEGLWLSGVLTALQTKGEVRYGADADHIQVKRGPTGLERAKQTIDACRYYTFYTLDMSDVLHYDALALADAAAEAKLREIIADSAERRDMLSWHGRERKFGGRVYQLTPAQISKFAGKYWDALNALADLAEYICGFKDGRPFDLEISIDEHPPEVAAFDCLTSAEETLFVLSEISRRGLSVTHVAPNFGFEKGHDYRYTDGLEGLEKRVREHFDIAEQFGVMLDFHSSDDLTSAPRKALHQGTGGRLHYKVSPMLQLLFADVLQDYHPDLFKRWWDDALDYVRQEVAAGSPFAKECLDAYETSADKSPSRHHALFHHYSFRFVGRRDSQGRFLQRGEFYQLSDDFYKAHHDRIRDWLCQLADELF